MTDEKKKELEALCLEFRKCLIETLHSIQTGHPGGSLSVCEILTTLYFNEANISPENIEDPNRDKIILCKGHAAPMLYLNLAKKGFFPMEVLDTLRKEGSPLQGHPSMNKCPGIDISTGSLGQGLACAVGMALAAKLDHKTYNVYCAVGDGECNEGEIWEACGTAHKYKLDNLVVFVDWNNLQLDGTCEEIMPPISLAKKFEAFGFEVYEIDGNDMAQMVDAMDKALAAKNGLPKCIVGKTIKGKGVSFMENQLGWHGMAPNDEQYKQAMEELNALYIKEEA